MHVLALLCASSLLLAVVLTPRARDFALRHGFLDRPDERRKLHAHPVPNLGGAPILLAYALSFAILWLLDAAARPLLDFAAAAKAAPAVLLIFATGVLDDRYKLKPAQKLLLQAAAAVAAYLAGVRVGGLAGHFLPAYLSWPATILWLVLCTNAINLMDGVDGLAAGLGIFAAATTLVAALMQHNLPLALATAPLAGALLGFLPYNFSPATMFLGDSGSLLTGFLLGCFGAVWLQKSATLLGMTAPLMALSIPLLDVCTSVVRRVRAGRPVFAADRRHIHHRLLDLGLGPRRTVLLLYAACGLGAVFSIFQSSAADHYASAVILVFSALTFAGWYRLREVEHRASHAGPLTSFANAFPRAETTEQRWRILRETAFELGFAEVRWQCAGTLHRDRRGGACSDQWVLRIPLEGEDFIELIGAGGASSCAVDPAEVSRVLRRAQWAPTPASISQSRPSARR